MIQIGTDKFAENGNEFEAEKCEGFARRLKRQIKFFDTDNNLIGVLNKWGCFGSATLRAGQYWYCHADFCEGLKALSFDARQDLIKSLTTSKTIDTGKFLERLHAYN